MKSIAQLETDRQAMAAQFEYGYANGKKDADAALKAINADLLQALEAMLSIEDSVTQGQEKERRAIAVPLARAAIAKAKV